MWRIFCSIIAFGNLRGLLDDCSRKINSLLYANYNIMICYILKFLCMIYHSRIILVSIIAFRNNITHNTIKSMIRYAHLFIYIRRMNLTERRSPENNLSNLMRHRLNERHECYFGPQNILIESFLSSPN